ncbi:unnamed protein product [Knipowitschia caucasica]
MDDERMIHEVQLRSVLYDATHPFYKDNSRKERAWTEVAEAMHADVTECKARWRTLRDSFVKHRKRMGTTNESPSTWKYGDIMAFLMPFVAVRKRNCASETEGERTPLSTSPPPPSAAPPVAPQKRPSRRSRSPRDRGRSWWGLGGGSRGQVPQSVWESYHFCLSLVPQLQRLSWRRRNSAKIHILHLLERLQEEEEQRRSTRGEERPRTETGQGVLEQLLVEDSSFSSLIGLSRCQFEEVLRLVGEKLTLQDTNYRKSIPAATRLCIGLRFLRSGQHFHAVAETFRVALSSVCKIVPQVVAVLCSDLQGELCPPSSQLWTTTEEEFRRRWDFPLCCGALDGRQVLLRSPPCSGSQSSSVVILAVVDARGRFLQVEVGGLGRVSDEGLLESSMLGQALCENRLLLPPPATLPGGAHRGLQPHVFVADDSFTLRSNIMRPFTGQAKRQGPRRRVFNLRLTRALCPANTAFNRLAKHWGLFQRTLDVRPESAQMCVRATCLLHNLLLRGEGEEEDEGLPGVDSMKWAEPMGEEELTKLAADTKEDHVGGASASVGVSSDRCSSLSAGCLRRLERGWAHRASKEALRVRDTLAAHFCEEGSVSWQQEN